MESINPKREIKTSGMYLNHFIQKLDPQKRNGIHFTRIYMYVYTQPVWKLEINTFDEQIPIFRLRMLRLLKKSFRKNVFRDDDITNNKK